MGLGPICVRPFGSNFVHVSPKKLLKQNFQNVGKEKVQTGNVADDQVTGSFF